MKKSSAIRKCVMPRLFDDFLGRVSLKTGCSIVLVVYLFANFVTVFACVSIYTIGDSLFLSRPNRSDRIDHLLAQTWNYYLIFVFITSCSREFLWISIAAVGLTVLAFVGVLMEVPVLMIPFLTYEISVNIFFSYVKILWCMVFGLAIHAPVEFVIFLTRIYSWLVLLSYCVNLFTRTA